MKAIFYVLIATLAISCMNMYGQRQKDMSEYKIDLTGTNLNKGMNKLEQTRKEKEEAARAGKGHSLPRVGPSSTRTGESGSQVRLGAVNSPVGDFYGGWDTNESEGKSSFFETPSSSANENKALSSLLVGDNKPQSASGGLEVEVKASNDEIRGYIGKSGSPVSVNPADMQVNMPPPPALDEALFPSPSMSEYGKEQERKQIEKDLAAMNANGCGTKELKVPDFLFKKVCDNHDIDYDIGTPKSEADLNLLKGAQKTCLEYLPVPVLFSTCSVVGGVYYFGVRFFGQKAYDSARAQDIARIIAAKQQVQAKNVHVEQRDGIFVIAIER